MTRPKILALSGSARRESVNQRLVAWAAGAAERAGADVTLINLRDYPMPIYNQDDEAESGLPEHAQALKTLFAEHEGLLIASPEYNGLPTPLLVNALDWVSRRADGETSMIAFAGKTAALVAASGGRLGGLRGLVHIRSLLTNLGVTTLPKQAAVGSAGQAFDADGGLVQAADIALVEAVVAELVRCTRALHAV